MKKIDVSIILPCYNQEKFLEKNFYKLKKVMDLTRYDYEIIIAEDGSTDNTYEIAKKIIKKNSEIRLIHKDKRLGRGNSVANAIKQSYGRVVGFIDTDLDTDPNYIPKLIMEINNGNDIVFANRVYKLKLYELFTLSKFITHHGYILLHRLLLKSKFKDIGSGCKFFIKKKILPILDEIKDKKWFWDTEIIIRPYYKGFRIKEIPTLYTPKYNNVSTVNLFRDTIDHFIKLIKLRKELKQKRN